MLFFCLFCKVLLMRNLVQNVSYIWRRGSRFYPQCSKCVIQIGPVPSPSRATLGKSPIQLARPQGGSSFPTPRTQEYHLTLRPHPWDITLHEGPTPGISLYTKALGIGFLRILLGVVIFRTTLAWGGQIWWLFGLGSCLGWICLGLWGRVVWFYTYCFILGSVKILS